ncbi:hypothetical protein B0J13DRAFT_490265 [Dactylonectria estremocensis]|uniref:Uncharacterized protein n=1 Tax=Dactylonectria estremocensis TaxID=1079267 RepID=A0A9P9CWY8_9HYPO|nr:hypothetical protein B0J13DRAFT_490355 [Dactylonectria estremocensis]KAH7108936.1 hypothetical protein B0J13DRAFT_490265 [Dactylonectria estremocensis]
MAAAAVASIDPVAVPDLRQPLDRVDLDVSCITYNELPYIDDQPALQYKGHVKALLDIIDRYSMGQYFGVHSAHRHDKIPIGTVRLERDLGIEESTWTKATAIENVDLGNIHATAFKLTQNALVAFEFAEGPSPTAGINITPQFLGDIATYLAKNDITNQVVLEVKDFAKRDAKGFEPTAEIEIQWGKTEAFTVVLPISARAEASRGIATLTPTGWNLRHVATGTAPSDPEPPAGEHYERVVVGPKKDTHKVIYTSNAPVTPNLLRQALAELGFIKA